MLNLSNYLNGTADLTLDGRTITVGAAELKYLTSIADFVDGGCFFDAQIAQLAFYRHKAMDPVSRGWLTTQIDKRIIVVCNQWLAEHPATSAEAGA